MSSGGTCVLMCWYGLSYTNERPTLQQTNPILGKVKAKIVHDFSLSEWSLWMRVTYSGIWGKKMMRLKIMHLPFLFLKNGFEEGTTEMASRSYPVNTEHLAAACYPPHPVKQFTPSSFPTPNMYPAHLGLSYLQPLWLLSLSCVGIGTTF